MGNKQSSLAPKTMQELKALLHKEFTEDEIREWYDEFRSDLKKGEKCLSKAKFINVYNKLFTGDATDFAAQVFRVFDTDNSQGVDFKEFMTGLYMSGTSDMDVKLKWAFQMYDIDKDNYISKNEMVHMFQAVCKMTESEMPDQRSPEELTELIFKEFDRNGDQKISFEEFREGVHKKEVNKMIVDILQLDPAPNE